MALVLKSSKKSTSYNRANNTRYVYMTDIYWDDINETYVKKRKVIGKIDPVTGQEVETGSRGRPRINEAAMTETKLANKTTSDKNDAKRTQVVADALDLIQASLNRLENDMRCIKDTIQTIRGSIESAS